MVVVVVVIDAALGAVAAVDAFASGVFLGVSVSMTAVCAGVVCVGAVCTSDVGCCDEGGGDVRYELVVFVELAVDEEVFSAR